MKATDDSHEEEIRNMDLKCFQWTRQPKSFVVETDRVLRHSFDDFGVFFCVDVDQAESLLVVEQNFVERGRGGEGLVFFFVISEHIAEGIARHFDRFFDGFTARRSSFNIREMNEKCIGILLDDDGVGAFHKDSPFGLIVFGDTHCFVNGGGGFRFCLLIIVAAELRDVAGDGAVPTFVIGAVGEFITTVFAEPPFYL